MEMLRYKVFSTTKSISFEKPVIVMLHGLGGGFSNWHDQVRELKNHFDLLLIELPSHGRSPVKMSDLEISYKQLCGKIIEVLDHLGIQKAHFAGVSFGTILVKYILLYHPERVDKYVLAAPLGSLGFLTRSVIAIVRYLLPVLSRKVVVKLITVVLMPSKLSKNSREIFLATAKRLSRKDLIAYCKLLLLYKRIQKTFLRRMKNQDNGLYLIGDLDYVFLPTLKEEAKSVKNMVIIPDAGHVCNIDQPAAANRHIISFLSVDTSVQEADIAAAASAQS